MLDDEAFLKTFHHALLEVRGQGQAAAQWPRAQGAGQGQRAGHGQRLG